MSNTIIYSHGCGNSAKVAKDIAVNFDDAKIYSAIPRRDISATFVSRGTIGIVVPAASAGLKAQVVEFLLGLRFISADYIYLVVIGSEGTQQDAVTDHLRSLLDKKMVQLDAVFTIPSISVIESWSIRTSEGECKLTSQELDQLKKADQVASMVGARECVIDSEKQGVPVKSKQHTLIECA